MKLENRFMSLIDEKVTNLHLYNYIMEKIQMMVNKGDDCNVRMSAFDLTLTDEKTKDVFAVNFNPISNLLSTVYIADSKHRREEKTIDFGKGDSLIAVVEKESLSYDYIGTADLTKVVVRRCEKLYIDDALAHRFDFESTSELKMGVTKGSCTKEKRLVVAPDNQAVQRECKIHEINGSQIVYKYGYADEPTFNTRNVLQQCHDYTMTPSTKEIYEAAEKGHQMRIKDLENKEKVKQLF